ncbi:copper homeostasis protein CutC [Carboxylicivirga sp. N1Y90]|uniref:copper homeostasis protein CutC n=1 Tax=Carboxylicivirga fragile TaxID=3417571 RepID=UPI003D34B4C4|nr:copper homeostasis protein CutC [Marinilabiliaceae bacterium N1Y90]
MIKLEISTYNIEGVKEAVMLDVDRLELCDNIKEGGTTPSFGLMEAAMLCGHKNVYAIIRPRGGDFLYSDDEFDIIKRDIINAKKAGLSGVVCGCLCPDGSVDTKRTKQLVELAKPLKFTFHRAFDMSKNHKESLKDLISIGVDTVLTSGLENEAVEGQSVIKELVDLSRGKIEILVGGGVNASNIQELHDSTKAQYYHMSATKLVKSGMTFYNPRLSMGNIEAEEYKKVTVDCKKISKAMKLVKKLNNST